MDKPKAFLTTPVAVLLGSFIVSFAILVSGGVIKLNGVNTQAQPQAAATAPAQAPQLPTAPTSSKVSVSNNPMLGSKDAKVTLIEFSDYECPFCKRHFDEVYPLIKKDYIDTGKVKLVYRNYPLPFHDPMATYEAQAALCAREQGGDVTYFKIHDEFFKKTTSNGTGLSKDKVHQIAADLGLNADNIISCADGNKYKEKVAKDISDGGAAGVSGTPSFFIGKSDQSGTITGQLIVGAQPYTVFQSAIDALLK